MKLLRAVSLFTVTLIALLLVLRTQPAEGQAAPQRDAAARQMKDGNWKEAYEGYSRLALDPVTNPHLAGEDLTNAVHCLYRLERHDEVDALLEKAVAAHPRNWRVLQAASQIYHSIEHHGYLIAGEFKRGRHRGGGKYANAFERDRVRALQLVVQAIANSGDAQNYEQANLHSLCAANLNSSYDGRSGWRLQTLTDLTTLPDYDEGYTHHGSRGAPVDEQGDPIFHAVPKSWEAAKNDGERWRWAWAKAVELNPDNLSSAQFELARFSEAQFGTQTLAEYGWFMRAQSTDGKTHESGVYELHTLTDSETIARLATGIKRFTLPDDLNYIKLYRQISDRKGTHAHGADCALGQAYENRRQFPRAAEFWRRAGDTYRVNQITGNWGQFQPVMTQPAGEAATVEYRFRNGRKVQFTAQPVNVEMLLNDVKAYIRAKPRQIEWNQTNIQEIGYRLVQENQTKYLGRPVAEWPLELTPPANHFDRMVTVRTPLKQAGAYLLTAKMENGNTSFIVVWVADTVIVKKPLDGKQYYFVADAVTGKPVGGAKLDFFGYNSEWVANREGDRGGGYYNVTSTSLSGTADANGQFFTDAQEVKERLQWVITATTPQRRLAYLGFTGVWYPRIYDREYNQTKAFVITDRPVYRPGQPVKFKAWVNNAKYDQEGKGPFAGHNIQVEIYNPKHEQVLSQTFTADEYGGIDGEFTPPKNAMLGVYRVQTPHGSGTFRVEEYKKPEFEVTVNAPSEPVVLGDRVTATINAKYYFGAPVTKAKVSYKILRNSHNATWYPVGRWDWLYGRGYWWFGYDYAWYPGWREWGCMRPVPVWWGHYGRQQPELVADGDAELDEQGNAELTIDTELARLVQGDTDHRYEITVEVTDQSRRTIVGQGSIIAARKPFKVYAWVHRGHYRVGDTVRASFNAQTVDGKPVQGVGVVKLYSLAYQRKDGRLQPVETEVQRWDLNPGADGHASLQMTASEAGQYRVSYLVTDGVGRAIEGGYVFTVHGEGFDSNRFRFNEIELVTDQQDYQPGDTVSLMINTNRENATVLLFKRPVNGVYLPPKVLSVQGKSAFEEIEVTKKDMPNFFVEAVTIYDGKVYSEVREIVVPPERRVVNVEVTPSKATYKPGEQATMKLKLTDIAGKPVTGSTVVSIYDRSVEYISGGSNVRDIKAFFWAWRRSHNPRTEHSLTRGGQNLVRSGDHAMRYLGVFGRMLIAHDSELDDTGALDSFARNGARAEGMALAFLSDINGPAGTPGTPMQAKFQSGVKGYAGDALSITGGSVNGRAGDAGGPMVEPAVRSNFADTALWVGAVKTNANGEAEVTLTMPENLTTWKARVWSMSDGTRVGEGATEVVTSKNLIVRLQAPRFFTQKDEVVISANVHNYLTSKKTANLLLELEGGCLVPMENLPEGNRKTVEVDANGEQRVDWRVQVTQPGEAKIRVKALTDEESDAMEMTFPVYVHGMLKTESFSGAIRPEGTEGVIRLRVPAERRPEQSRLEVRYSPTLAGAMVDALPYLVDYPYDNTEATLNRFLPTVITQKVLLNIGLNLKDIQQKRSNLNAQEIGDDKARAEDWQRTGRPWSEPRNPVFDEAEAARMVQYGQERLQSMQCADGGWGWFSGYGEHSWPHTTALVVHGLQIARTNNALTIPEALERGVAWLVNYRAEQVRLLKLYVDTNGTHGKAKADAVDAFVYMVLADEKKDNVAMRDYLYRDRIDLPVYAKAMFGIALHRVNDLAKRDMLIRNIDQYLMQDNENQTAYLKLPGNNWWWYWYGSEYEAQAYYLKLLALTEPKGEKASRLVKYLLNNRKHATYWNSTRDTAIVVEAFADYLKATDEMRPDMTVDVLLDGRKVKSVRITAENLFSFDNKFVLTGPAVTAGNHTVKLVKTGKGPLYYNAYLTNFTLEDPITRAGLEIKVDRKFYRLKPVFKAVQVEGTRGQALSQQVEKYTREPLENLNTVKSGDLIEVELIIDSKNDYEYIMFEDMKAAGCEPVAVRSGYGGNEMGAYVELRDERVCFFVRHLARGTHSLSYRLRAEVPGQFSALPTKAAAVYAPELKANSDEMKLRIED